MGKKPDITITSDYLNYVRNQIQKAITTLCQKEYLDKCQDYIPHPTLFL